MISINIYRPPSLNVDINIPTCWNDLEKCELQFIAKTLLDRTPETDNETKPRIFKFILENRCKKDNIKLPKNFLLLLDVEEVVIQVFPLLSFIFETNDLTNLPDTITIRLIKFYPRPFDEITCGEFEDCEILTKQFADDEKVETLANLAAVLFRPRNRPYMQYHAADDTYQVYRADQKVKLFMKLRPAELYAILIWYAGSRSQLPKFFPDLYDGGKKNDDPNVFTNSIHAGAGPKNGTRNQIRCTKLYEFLYECNQEAIKAKEIEAEYERMNKK